MIMKREECRDHIGKDRIMNKLSPKELDVLNMVSPNVIAEVKAMLYEDLHKNKEHHCPIDSLDDIMTAVGSLPDSESSEHKTRTAEPVYQP
ncbi:hypothetical protein V6N12_033595 [Hibiscus sabdariffa]|uniref:NET domain-containing protein n=1 Tax=Hibiscus sabdariffa TaxID=183260 RepID=A0ABR2BW54_9ROSI